MRNAIRGLAIVVALAVPFLFTSGPAAADGWHHRRAPAGYGTVQTVRHWGYYPRYRHVTSFHYVTDPYLYRYEPRGYYPYYNSGYWRPAAEVRAKRALQYRLVQPPYYAAWGYPVPTYHHRAWHAVHHGYIRRGHW
jgi:hypothetical protein